MKIAITGSTGLIGRALLKYLPAQLSTSEPIEWICLKRSTSVQENECDWNPKTGEISSKRLENTDIFIHLAGENVAAKRWTSSFKQELRKSRIDASEKLVSSLMQLNSPPKHLIAASAIGIYGCEREGVKLTEDSELGNSFLANLTREWEASCNKVDSLKTKLSLLRLSMVLAPKGGALEKLLPVFRLGFGGPLGSGKQMWSWIHIQDVVKAVAFCIEENLYGPINLSSPSPCTQKEFGLQLGRILKRPAVTPTPAFVLKLIVGEMAKESILADLSVYPQRLVEQGFQFEYDELNAALKQLLIEIGLVKSA